MAEERCPYLRIIRGGDESMDYCDLVDKWCEPECEVYVEFLKAFGEVK